MPAIARACRLPLVALLAACTLVACGKPQVPEHDNPPAPRADTAEAPPSALRETMQAPIDKTRAAEDATKAAEAQRDAALETATGE
jgi:hypothetical protein